MSFAGYFLVRFLLYAFHSFLRTYSQFDLVWSRLSCDHGWIRSGLINVRKTTTNNNNCSYRDSLGNGDRYDSHIIRDLAFERVARLPPLYPTGNSDINSPFDIEFLA